MFSNPELARLEQRKRELMVQSAANRRQLAAGVAPLQPIFGWCDLGLGLFKKVKAFWPLIALAAGFLVERKGFKSSFWRKASSGFGAVKNVLAVWNRFKDGMKSHG
jgi:hypothetical protein